MTHIVRNILEKNRPRPLGCHQPHYFEEQGASRILESQLLAAHGKRLARESPAKHIVIRYLVRRDFCYIPGRLFAEISLISRDGMLVYFGTEDALAAKSLQAYPKSSNTREQIDESKHTLLENQTMRSKAWGETSRTSLSTVSRSKSRFLNESRPSLDSKSNPSIARPTRSPV